MFDDVRGGIEALNNGRLISLIIALLLLIGLTALVWGRTRSTHSLMTKLWRLFHGSVECKDQKIGKFLDQQSALMEFRFKTGIPVRTKRHAEDLIIWAERNDEDMGNIAACGGYFDLERVTLKDEAQLPRKWMLLCIYLFSFVPLFLCCAMLVAMSVDRALLQIKASGTYFTVSKDYAKAVVSGGKIAPGQCSGVEGFLVKGFSRDDARVVCNLFESKDFGSYIDGAVREQRVALAWGVLLFGVMGFAFFKWLVRGVRSREMLKRLRKRAEGGVLALLEEGDAPSTESAGQARV